MADEPALCADAHLEAQPVAAVVAAGGGGSRLGAHLPYALRAQHPLVTAQQEGGEPRQVPGGGPQLTGRGHHPEVLRGLGHHQVRPRVHRPAARVRCARCAARPVQPQRLQHLGAQHVLPRLPAERLDEGTQQRVTGVRVVVDASGSVLEGLLAQHLGQPGPQFGGGTLPPLARGLGRQSARVGEQLGHGHLVGAGPGQVPAQRVREVQQALVAQPHHQNGREGLGDRPDPVLHVPVRAVALDRGPGALPEHLPTARDGRHQGRCAPLALRDGEAVPQRAPGGGEQFQIFSKGIHARDATCWPCPRTANNDLGRPR